MATAMFFTMIQENHCNSVNCYARTIKVVQKSTLANTFNLMQCYVNYPNCVFVNIKENIKKALKNDKKYKKS